MDPPLAPPPDRVVDDANEPEEPIPTLAVEVIRSPKRRKTAQARLVGSTVEIRIPARCSGTEEAELVDHFRAKFERSRAADTVDLTQQATKLAHQFGLPEPASIRWVSNQRFRWGSCTPVDGSVRLSDRMTEFPPWVIDYVIVHELAHLVVENHSAAFWALVDNYPLTERARGYLLAMAEVGN
ncbi:MAG: M48 family metallopeptidase [Actinomycetia bacterium]|nr:M48 family metallopeptidase [Actinomycetes bacterium]